MKKGILTTYKQMSKIKYWDYKLTIYLCSGSDSEKLEWFKTINIAGEKTLCSRIEKCSLSWSVGFLMQKDTLARNGCAAYSLGSDYLKGTPN